MGTVKNRPKRIPAAWWLGFVTGMVIAAYAFGAFAAFAEVTS